MFAPAFRWPQSCFQKLTRHRELRNDSKYDFISESCYLFILPVKLRSSALVVCTVGRGERSRGVPTGHNGSHASASLDLHLSARPPRRLRSSSQGSRKSAKSDCVFS